MVKAGRTRAALLAGVVAGGAVVAIVIVLLARSGGERTANDGPTGTVHQFLNAVALRNGDEACGYLTPAEIGRVQRAAGPHVACSEALGEGELVLGGHDYIGDLGAVSFADARNGDHATVDATNGSGSLHFGLTVASVNEETAQTYYNPASNWRIDAGAASLVPALP